MKSAYIQSAAPPRLVVRGLSVTRQGARVLDGLELTLRAGSTLSVAGASGGGKSTLLRALAGLERREAGTIVLDGMDSGAIPHTEYRRRVSLVLQDAPMFEGTVADNVRYGPALRGAPVDDARVASLLEKVALSATLMARDAAELSGGERQRVALARALANEPDVLLLDEPTSALDPTSSDEVIDQVRALVRSGVAAIAVLHSREHALRFGDERYRLVGGRLEPDTAP